MTQEEKVAHDALLEQVRNTAKQEIETRGYQNKEAVESILNKALEGVPLEALRSYDSEKINTSLRNIAAEVEKVKNIRTGVELQSRSMLEEAVGQWVANKQDGAPSDMELLFRSKGKGSMKEVQLNLRAAATMTTDNTINENNYPQQMIESMSLVDGIVKKRRGVQYIFDFATRTTVDEIEQYTTWLEEGQEQGAFALVSEGAVKPLVSTGLVRNFTAAKKIAGKMVVTEEFVKFRRKIYTYIQDLLNDKVLRDYAAILTTDLQAQSAAYVGTSLDDTIAIPTDYDAIGAVAAQIETLNFAPDLLIIHPQDKWRLALERDSQNRYYFMIPTYKPDGTVEMMGFRVLTSTYQTIGTFTLGESGLFKIEDEAFTVRLGYGIDVTIANGVVTNVTSDFDTNRMRMIIETYFKDWIATNHAGSFVTASFNTVKGSLLKPAA